MSCIRPATPGFLITLVATALLAVVVFCVPYFKSVYFLKATITVQNVSGDITFGTLGYCVELLGNTTCSSPSIGYELDINGLVGNRLPVQIPQVVVKWITYLLFLHVIALIGAAGSAVFGLLAHVREMSMGCCSTCFSGLAAVVTLIAFILDLVIFFVAKSRINAIGYASIGNAIWLTLTAWVLLFFSSCFFTVGRCCIKGRSGSGSGSGKWGGRWMGRSRDPEPGSDKNYAEQMRLDAVKAEADRKARQKQGEVGLPAFYETQPLTGHAEGDQIYRDGDRNQSKHELPPRKQSTNFKGGYAPGPTGTRTVDDYYNKPRSPAPTYPPRQRSEYSNSTYAPSTSHSPPPQAAPAATGYAASAGYAQFNAPVNTSPQPPNQLLAPPGQYNADPYGREYGHTAGGTSFHTAISHDRGLSNYSQYDTSDPYYGGPPPQQQQQQPQYAAQLTYNDPYAAYSGFVSQPPPSTAGYYPPPPPSTSPPPIHQPQSLHGDRSYTLGNNYGSGYSANQLPPLPEQFQQGVGYLAYAHSTPPAGGPTPPLAPIDTAVGGYSEQPQVSQQMSPVKGPRPQPGPDEAPPGYEPSVGVSGNWGKR